MSLQVQRSRRRRERRTRSPKRMYRIKARINHKDCVIRTPEFGTFAELWKKHGQRGYIYFCADVFNELGEPSYRLDSDEYPNHTATSLESYGRHKAWVMPGWRLNGKKVVFVRDAAKHEMTIIIETTSEMRTYLEWLRFHSKRLKVPEGSVFVALAKEWKAETIEVVIPPPRPAREPRARRERGVA